MGNGQVREMTKHRLTLPFLSGVCDPVWNVFTSVRIIIRKEGGGFRRRTDEVQGCFDGRMKKTISEIPMRTVDDIF